MSKYLRQVTTGRIYPYTEVLSKRRDMVLIEEEKPAQKKKSSKKKKKALVDEAEDES